MQDCVGRNWPCLTQKRNCFVYYDLRFYLKANEADKLWALKLFFLSGSIAGVNGFKILLTTMILAQEPVSSNADTQNRVIHFMSLKRLDKDQNS